MYLGIDVGTSSLKALLSDDKGNIIDSQSCAYPLLLPKENWAEQNPDDWFNAQVKVIKALGKRHDLTKIKGVSFCGQMHGLVLLDKNDKVIRPALLWNDNRTVDECNYLNNVVGHNKLITWAGNIAFTGFTAPKILWIKNNERSNFAKINKIMLPKDYTAYKMTGVFASDYSDGSGTLYMDVKHKTWSKKMLDVLGINETQLPKLYESYQPIGNVSKQFAQLTGMSTKTKVVIGGGDQAVGAVGTGTVGDNQLSISLGTSGVVFASCNHFAEIASGAMHSFVHANGKYHVMGVMLSAAGSYNWWTKEILHTQDFKVLEQEISKSNATNLYFLPYLSGERSPINDPNARGAFSGITLSHTRGDLTKAVIEGVNFGLLDCLKSINEIGINPQNARVIGGGSKSKAWLQNLADILGIKLHTINTSDGGGLGAIILAMTGCGQFKSVEEGCSKIIKNVQTFTPNAKKHQYYLEKFAQFKNLYQSLKK